MTRVPIILGKGEKLTLEVDGEEYIFPDVANSIAVTDQVDENTIEVTIKYTCRKKHITTKKKRIAPF